MASNRILRNIFKVAAFTVIVMMNGYFSDISLAAGEATRSWRAGDTPVTITLGGPETAASRGKIELLRQRVKAQGQIRVIVGLALPFRAEDTLSAAEARAQQLALQGLQSEVARRTFGNADAQSGDRFTFIPYMSLFVTAAELERLLVDPGVSSIQEDIPAAPMLAESGRIVHAPDLWAKNITGTNQVIAVLDTGVDKSHPMLAGKVVSEACYSTTNTVTGDRSFCPGGVSSTTANGSAKYCPLSIAGCDHGTHVAGIAAGNGSRVDGIARGARIIAIQVFSRAKTSTPNVYLPLSYTSDQVKALQRVYALRKIHRIAAVNMSLGAGAYAGACDALFPALTDAMTKLRNAGIATIIASGNSGYIDAISQPACISVAIPVGNTQKDDRLYGGPNTSLPNGGSNHSDQIRLLAPGTGIVSSVPGNKYKEMTGTSMASPHVAGAFALLRQVKPAATIDEIAETLRCTGKPVNRVFISGTGTGSGLFTLGPYRRRIDLIGAYNMLKNLAGPVRSWSFASQGERLDWAALYGNWVVEAGHLMPKAPRTRGVGIEVSTCLNNVEVVARMKRVEQKTMSGYMPETGIVVRSQSSFKDLLTSGYAAVYRRCKANSSGHCSDSATGPWGVAEFYRFDQQRASDSFAVRKNLCRKSSPVNVGGYNTIKVTSNGTRHSFYLNGNLVCTVNDSTYTDGDVMLYGGPAPLPAYGLTFDSVSLKILAPNPVPNR